MLLLVLTLFMTSRLSHRAREVAGGIFPTGVGCLSNLLYAEELFFTMDALMELVFANS